MSCTFHRPLSHPSRVFSCPHSENQSNGNKSLCFLYNFFSLFLSLLQLSHESVTSNQTMRGEAHKKKSNSISSGSVFVRCERQEVNQDLLWMAEKLISVTWSRNNRRISLAKVVRFDVPSFTWFSALDCYAFDLKMFSRAKRFFLKIPSVSEFCFFNLILTSIFQNKLLSVIGNQAFPDFLSMRRHLILP